MDKNRKLNSHIDFDSTTTKKINGEWEHRYRDRTANATIDLFVIRLEQQKGRERENNSSSTLMYFLYVCECYRDSLIYSIFAVLHHFWKIRKWQFSVVFIVVQSFARFLHVKPKSFVYPLIRCFWKFFIFLNVKTKLLSFFLLNSEVCYHHFIWFKTFWGG